MTNEQLINFRYNRNRWHIIKMISARLMCSTETGEIRACTGSDTIREMLDLWLSEKSVQWFPKILADFKKQGIVSKTTAYLKQCIRDYAESARINSVPRNREDYEQQSDYEEQLRIQKESIQELIDLKKRMLQVGFTEAEYKAITGEK